MPLLTRDPDKSKLRPLTSIRFFAAMLVVLYHTLFLIDPVFLRPVNLAHSSTFTRVISLGYVSVSFFFFLSGYILARVYLRPACAILLSRYYLARFARIYPLFLVAILLDVPYIFMEKLSRYGVYEAASKTFISLGASTLMLQAWVPRLGTINFPSWSLSVEAFLYFLFPFVGSALWRIRRSRLWVAAVAIYLAGQIAVLLAGSHVSAEAAKRQPLLHLTTFTLGILLARWQASGSLPCGSQAVEIAGWPLVGLAATLVVAFMPQLSPDLLNDGLLAPIFACIVLLLSGPTGVVNRLLSAEWLVILGEASFALYLIHIPLLHAYLELRLDRFPVLYPLYLVLCIGLSLMSYRLVETPLRKRLCNRARGPLQTPTTFVGEASN